VYVRNGPSRYIDPFGLKIDLSLSSPELNVALEVIKRTGRGRQLYDMMEADPRPCRIIALPRTGIAQRIPGTCDIALDPFAYREVATLAGWKQASLERLLAHEMGHAATNVHDSGPGKMDNVNLNENPVVRELGLRERTAYDIPFWWYLPLIGYPKPQGVEMPR
jgi:hypothetical protein